MTRFLLIVVVCLGLAFAPAAWAADRRVALVVGAGRYQNAPALANPPNDARLIAPLLQKLGFETQLVIDPDYDTLKRAVRNFGDRLDGASVALFYYAGHGLQVSGRNYLLPVNATIAKEADLRYEAFDVQAILDQMDGPNRVNLVFLDACRDNPFARSLASHLGTRSAAVGRGLARVDTNASGMLIAYATDPENVAADGDGSDSPFTTALARHIMTPGLDVRQMLTRVRVDVRTATNGQQRPWVSDALDSDFYFVAPGRNAPPDTQSALTAPSPQQPTPLAPPSTPMAMTTPPAAPIAPIPLPSTDQIPRTFLIFFDWQRDDVTARGKSLIAEFVGNYGQITGAGVPARIFVGGHVDMSETDAPNSGLSQRRAKAVVAELLKDGVPSRVITAQSLGTTQPLFPTNPGVREPRNRFVDLRIVDAP